MHHLKEGLEEILSRAKARAEEAKATTTNTPDSSNNSECGCVDGFILDGWTARECECQQRKRLFARMKNAMIPGEYEQAEFSTFRTEAGVQVGMLQRITEYMEKFDQIHNQQINSFGFIAVFGEQKLREIKNSAQRAQMKAKHNNFGIGKTHLQIAAAKELIKRGYTVLCISDVAFMEEMSKARGYNDSGEAVTKLKAAAIHAPVLVWDDIGKAKPSEFRLDMYYEIINERYKAKRPIIFSSNEDSETLTERIGDAAASRLMGMARGRLFQVEGKDHRLAGGKI
ncbi:ATP-binding protein [Ferviditalea candida]|uniref:ATP-binding protein n=1 Tax=Ferviditalea candida TaxID=3108399 RepID=A0ABU5ZLB2_9BACL|nr:ATP-binding protein [Paenibacillaceae bacterium T2]